MRNKQKRPAERQGAGHKLYSRAQLRGEIEYIRLNRTVACTCHYLGRRNSSLMPHQAPAVFGVGTALFSFSVRAVFTPLKAI